MRVPVAEPAFDTQEEAHAYLLARGYEQFPEGTYGFWGSYSNTARIETLDPSEDHPNGRFRVRFQSEKK